MSSDDKLKVAPRTVEGRDTQGHPEARQGLKIAVVVQRYGADVNGGAELHARYIAEHLAKHAQVEVLTTCAADYITWRNERAEGAQTVNGVPVRRFPVTRERDPDDFGRHSARVFTRTHSIHDELAWLDAEGPTSPALIKYIRANESSFDFFIFFSFRYYHAYHGIHAVPSKAILVPTAERDGALGLSIFGPVLRNARAIMYNSFEERTLIQAVSNNRHVPGTIVGIGSEIPPHSSASRFRQKFNFRDRFAIYIGRIDENKGCAELFEYFQRYAGMLADSMHLVLIGNPILPIPSHPKIHHLGFVSDEDKFDALAAAQLLIMPSYFESLSMVALEAWALGKPVLANGRCDVLKGQCIRSNGGLYYENFAEFAETLRAIDFTPSLAMALGRNGRDYFSRHYAWPIIERKYLETFERLKREPSTAMTEAMPGWFARRRKTLPPADEVVDRLPKGAQSEERPASSLRQESRGLRPEGRGTRTEGRGFNPAHSTEPPRTEGRGAPVPGERKPAEATRLRQGSGPSTSSGPSRAPSRDGGQEASALRTQSDGRTQRDEKTRGDGRPPGDRRQSRGPHRRRRPGGRPPRRPGNR